MLGVLCPVVLNEIFYDLIQKMIILIKRKHRSDINVRVFLFKGSI